MGLVYGIGVVVSGIATFETGKEAIQKHNIEETAKAFFYLGCTLGWIPGGALTGVAVCALHAWSKKGEAKEYYFLDIISRIGAVTLALYHVFKDFPRAAWNHYTSNSNSSQTVQEHPTQASPAGDWWNK
jgi:hypothetical protein